MNMERRNLKFAISKICNNVIHMLLVNMILQGYGEIKRVHETNQIHIYFIHNIFYPH